MTLLVIGASGLVGGELSRLAKARGMTCVGAARAAEGEATRVVDLQDRASIDALLADVAPSAIAICSAWPHVDGCEADPARSLCENVKTVENLLASVQNTRVLFYSTDHVFDGALPRYVEHDATRPLSVYAQHKRQVEELLLARGHSLVVRTAWVFGVERRRKNFLYRVLSAAKSGERLKLPVLQSGSPTWAGWLAESTLTLLDRHMEGLVHLTGSEALTKAEWALRIAQELALPPLDVEEVTWEAAGQIAPRPERVVLASERHELVQPSLRSILQAQRREFA